MNKKDLVKSLARVLSTVRESHDAVENIFSAMRKALRSGDKVVISGFGSFHPHIVRSKKGRNPRTGEILQLAPRRKVKFRQSKDLLR
jgi:nucleoid DNA-binding protein